MPALCPIDARKFRAGVNMAPAQIRAWAEDPRAKLASWPTTRARLPALATLREKDPADWTERDCAFARRVNSFNARMQGVVDTHGCTPKAVISLRNWGHRAPGCALPK